MAGDDRLADLAAAGDERAFTVIFERHHQALYRYCRSILGNDEDASDALQNTMLRALRALPGEKRTIQLKPWLFRIAHNEAITLVRRRRPQADVADEALGLQSPGPDVDSDTRERVERLFEDLRELPERQRSALIMRELSGLSYDEIAAALRTSTGAATQAVFGARKALHEFAAGRDMLCEEIRREISRRDGRILASRRIRAHLRRCEDCTAFRAMIAERERQFAAMAPPMPAVAAAAMLQGLTGGGGAGGGLTGSSGAMGSSHAVVSAATMKAAPMLLAAAVGAGAGAITQSDVSRVTARDEPVAAVRALAERTGAKAHAAAAVLALRAGVHAPAAAGRAGGAAPASGTGTGGESSPGGSGGAGLGGADPLPGAGGPSGGGRVPAVDRPVTRAPAPRVPPRRPAPTGQRLPVSAPGPGPAPTPGPGTRPTGTAPTTSTPMPTPAPAPAPAPSPPATSSPPPTPTDDREPDDDADDRPKKPRPCRPSPPPRGHPDGPCPS